MTTYIGTDVKIWVDDVLISDAAEVVIDSGELLAREFVLEMKKQSTDDYFHALKHKKSKGEKKRQRSEWNRSMK